MQVPGCFAERQIAYGKNTLDYDEYLKVPKQLRKDRMPRNLNKFLKYSRRQWDGIVKKWKRGIHVTVACSLGKYWKTVNSTDAVVTAVDESAGKIGNFNLELSWTKEVEAEEACTSGMLQRLVDKQRNEKCPTILETSNKCLDGRPCRYTFLSWSTLPIRWI